MGNAESETSWPMDTKRCAATGLVGGSERSDRAELAIRCELVTLKKKERERERPRNRYRV